MARILTITLNPALDLSVETAPLTLGEVNRTGHTLMEPAGKGINV
ncbi:MAG TPA: 1-phosphofructokinase, partial [Marinobacter adhaerens]|nr:1-phosphofructokinase [Marinobacter adhaerens]